MQRIQRRNNGDVYAGIFLLERGCNQYNRFVLGARWMLHDCQALALGTEKQEEICEAGSRWKVMERTEQSVKFEGWLKVHMKKNDIESYSDLAKIFGITRQTLYAWIKDPRKLKKYTIAGIMHMLNVQNNSLEDLCLLFGIERI